MQFYIYNIKIQSETRGLENKTQVYEEVFEKMASLKQEVKIAGETYAICSSYTKDNEILYGSIIKFTKISGNNWVDVPSGEIENGIDIPENKYPNAKIAQFYFNTIAHRIYIDKKLTSKQAKFFLQNALKSFVAQDEDLEVEIETAQDAIDEILKAKEIKSLDIVITPSNDDAISGMLEETIDDDLKKTGVAKLEQKFRPSNKNASKIQNSNFAKASLNLAKTNGNVKADIVNEHEEKKKIVTEDYPAVVNVPGKKPSISELISFFKNRKY